MAKLTVPRLRVGESVHSVLSDANAFANIPENHLDCLNWAEEYPYKPEVSFRIFHNDEFLFLEYNVREKCTAALEMTDGNDVYRDSCVEFFVQPEGDGHYYNFEWNAIGTLCMSRRTGRFDPVHAPMSVLDSVLTSSTYGRKPFEEIKGDNAWTLRIAIPASALFCGELKTWHCARLKGNFYKCGDALSTPHYITWAPISTPSPDYHRAEFFAEIDCE